LASLKRDNIKLNKECSTVEVTFASSKTDIKALSCVRTWGCTCVGHQGRPCPFHAAAFIEERHNGGPESPFITTSTGGVVAKADMVRSFEKLAMMTGGSPSTCTSISGHTARVSGAQFLAKLGLEVYILQILARHASSTILRYVRDAPLAQLTEMTRLKWSATSRGEHAKEGWIQEAENLRQAIKDLQTTPRPPGRYIAEDKVDETEVENLVQNTLTGVIHKVLTEGEVHCKWRYSSRPHMKLTSSKGIGSTEFCEKCMPVERLAALQREAEEAEDDGSSSSSAESGLEMEDL
jgi:hypothetical protein